MPPNRLSRHRFSYAFRDDAGRMYLTEAVPYAYRDLPGNRQHLVMLGDTLFNLAGLYFAGIPSANQLWWIIAQFQPDPIVDPTVALVPGTTLVIPSNATVTNDILNERRKQLPTPEDA